MFKTLLNAFEISNIHKKIYFKTITSHSKYPPLKSRFATLAV
nr:MAG TPA: hypothetical protein [Caudoviricetes sp.]